ncbi:MAG TPA: alpha/beta hydrolase [Stellaceae bacterium]
MLKVFATGLIAAMIAVASVQTAKAEPSAFKVGMTRRDFVPPEPYDWRGDPKHALATTIWYPADAGAQEKPLLLGPPGRPLFDGGRVATDAALVRATTKFPLVVLSHGTGGTAANLAWLGTVLAAHGYIVAAVNHPGNNAIDGYTVPGFRLWWLRALDLSAVIDGILADPTFGPRIDPKRIGAAGHSLGGYTVIEIAGGITSIDHLRAFCTSPKADKMCIAPPEFADMRPKAEALAKTDPAFRAALARDSRSYRHPRVRAVFAMAPALGPVFLPDSLAHIVIPVAIVAGASDEIVPIGSSAQFLAAMIPHAELTILPGAVGHYVFVGICLEAGRAILPSRLCNDVPEVDRAAIEAETAALAVRFFDRTLH